MISPGPDFSGEEENLSKGESNFLFDSLWRLIEKMPDIGYGIERVWKYLRYHIGFHLFV